MRGEDGERRDNPLSIVRGRAAKTVEAFGAGAPFARRSGTKEVGGVEWAGQKIGRAPAGGEAWP